MKATKTLYWILAALFAFLLGCSRTPATPAVHTHVKAVQARSLDPRSDAAIAEAACAGRCAGSAIKPLMASNGSTPIIPPSWTVPAWYVDPQNTTTCASDTNSGTTSTCYGGCSGSTCPSGIGPLLTYQELGVHRWGTYSPRLRQTTAIDFLSADSNATDPLYCQPLIENGALFSIVNGQNVLPIVGPQGPALVNLYDAFQSVPDGQGATNCTIGLGSHDLYCPGMFTAANVGKTIAVTGAGTDAHSNPDTLVTTIASFISSDEVSLTAAATTAVSSGGIAVWGTDNGPIFQKAVNALAGSSPGTGQILYVPQGNYALFTGVSVPSYTQIAFSQGATILAGLYTSQYVPFGSQSIVFFAINDTYGPITSFSSATASGAIVLPIANIAGYSVGEEIFITAPGYTVGPGMVRTIQSISPNDSGTGGTFTVDRGLPIAMPNAAYVQGINAPASIHISGPGTVTGTVQRFIELASCQLCTVSDLYLSNEYGYGNQWIASFDTGSYACDYHNVHTIGPYGIACEGNENCGIYDSTATLTGSAAAANGFTLNDCAGGSLVNDVASCQNITASVNGLLIGSETGYQCTGINIQGGLYQGCQTGILMSNSNNSTLTAVRSVNNSVNLQLDTDSIATRVLGGDYSAATGASGIGIAVTSTAQQSYVSGAEIGGCGTYGILAYGDAVINGVTSATGSGQTYTEGDIGAINGGSYEPIVEITDFNLVQDQGATGNPAAINVQDAFVKIASGEIVLNNSGATGLSLLGSGKSFVSFYDVDFKGSNAYYAIFMPFTTDSALRYGRDRFGSFTNDFAAGVSVNRGTVVANGSTPVAVPFLDMLAIDKITLTPTSGNPKAWVSSQTAGTGFDITSTAGDTQTYQYTIE